MSTSRSLPTMVMTLSLLGLMFGSFGLLFALLGSGGYTGHVAIQQAIPTRVAATPEEVRENWEKLAETINSVREKQALADATTDPTEKERLQNLADELQKQAETLANWLDSHGAVIPELKGRLICAWCTTDLGTSGTVEDSHGVCEQCLEKTFGPYLEVE